VAGALAGGAALMVVSRAGSKKPTWAGLSRDDGSLGLTESGAADKHGFHVSRHSNGRTRWTQTRPLKTVNSLPHSLPEEDVSSHFFFRLLTLVKDTVYTP